MKLNLITSIKSPVINALRQSTNFVLPPLCLACHVRTDHYNVLCASCWSKINFITMPYCQRLGIPLPFGTEGPMISAEAAIHPPLYDQSRSVAYFDGPMRDMIHTFKYADNHAALALFGKWLAQAGQDILQDADMLLPVPLYRWRLWSRRFNQAALLAQAVAKETGIKVNMQALIRQKETTSQVGLTLKQRKKNVSGAFTIKNRYRNLFYDRNIVLVDDVLTSGATVEACTKVLKAAHAKHISVLTLARVINPTSLTM